MINGAVSFQLQDMYYSCSDRDSFEPDVWASFR